MNAATDVRGLRKDFATATGRLAAITGMTFTVRRGAICAVVGPSGSGKTTLLTILAGLDAATAGEVWVDGYALHRMTVAQRTAFRIARVGLVFQANNLLPVLTAAENVALPLVARGVACRERTRRVEALLDRLDLRTVARHRPGELSGGQQQRVGIARALIVDPAIVLADEPTAHLDSNTGREVLHLFTAANRERGTTFIFSTHDPAIEALAGERLAIRDGATVSLRTVSSRSDEWQPCSVSPSVTSADTRVAPSLPREPSRWASSS